MADRDRVIARIADTIAGIEPSLWDSLAGNANPFLSHSFLSALEVSGSVGGQSGWSPLPILVEDAGEIVAAAPAYLKSHSQGEYVFDHGWADAWQRAGGDYYPKLQVAVPFTPVPGRRLLGTRPQALLAALEAVTEQNGLSSAHATFIADEEQDDFAARHWLIRHGIQYHWFNRGFGSFDDFLDTLASRKRKALRKERQAAQQGLEIVALRGTEVLPAHWDAMWAFYRDTGSRKWGRPYLTRAFFDRIAEAQTDALLLFLALREGQPIAGALNWIGEDTLYGRYWGCTDEVPYLHFELCYYQAIDWACRNGLDRVEAGAQGEHKLARGYEPVITRSAHFIPNPSFRDAVARFVEAEREGVAIEIEALRAELPFKQA
ncbi:GNAT family N-acetyltransferase [Sphingomonas sp. KRR8]|uniref:GNAT family N-acetyltransferase n=1 Tax=Sphingomonas sp. KRR8 TaxID=2942996 RepID=UPI0020228DA1|nr:GNAT family N-acetyltransferase [Sphingomonas sp. KRR8]URD60132.1 GNAT family N-acetyltransferase [Sphingomonas sp. KRR8]